jgi:hypothetical protein
MLTRAEGGETADLKPGNGFIPDAGSAASLAHVILSVIYGAEQVSRQQPLTATESAGVWRVLGQRPRGTVGGVAEIDISRIDGQVLRVSHSR